MLLYGYIGCIFFTLLPNTYSCLFTKIQSNVAIWQYIAMHSNTIHNTALTRIVSPLLASLVGHCYVPYLAIIEIVSVCTNTVITPG